MTNIVQFGIALLSLQMGIGSGQLMGLLGQVASPLIGKQISRNPDDLKYLYIPSASEQVELTYKNNAAQNLQSANLKTDQSVVITIDGFLSNSTTPMSKLLREAYTKRDQENLIILDWSRLSGSGAFTGAQALPLMYLRVVGNVEAVGKRLAAFVQDLSKQKDIPLSRFHLIGGSLGAHIAGVAGKALKSKVGRITGLDPAGPLFNIQLDQSKRLTKSDAQFVDVFHSNMGGFGDTTWDIGQFNVFLNGGTLQPGCSATDVVCNHAFAFQTWGAAVNGGNFTACPCTLVQCLCSSDCSTICEAPVTLGPETPTSARGRYHATVPQLV